MRPTQLLFVVVLMSIVSCTAKITEKSLYKQFSAYALTANNNNILSQSPKFFSKRLLAQANSSKASQAEIAGQLLFKQYMATQVNSFEVITDNSGCLTVNGYDSENMPLSFNLKYIHNQEKWLIDDINISFVNSEADFSTSAQCPGEYIN
ncbi:hypothetical protein SG34_028570 [Thalassomonas viridans]|uniref:DUF3828 domain-containing protein n=1 Tax=Thalassomonas viridans TaxID=137584 RepID=A0AAF0C7D9_9GAMM|nr:hypothetical protein [Thalassomonas viridans]WDE05202.1 hypothetical protein SG34_028570 [Thalassomonas viridans]